MLSTRSWGLSIVTTDHNLRSIGDMGGPGSRDLEAYFVDGDPRSASLGLMTTKEQITPHKHSGYSVGVAVDTEYLTVCLVLDIQPQSGCTVTTLLSFRLTATVNGKGQDFFQSFPYQTSLPKLLVCWMSFGMQSGTIIVTARQKSSHKLVASRKMLDCGTLWLESDIK